MRWLCLSSLADETPEGKSIVELAGTKGIKVSSDRTGMSFHQLHCRNKKQWSRYLPNGTKIRKGAFDAIRDMVIKNGNPLPKETEERVKTIAQNGGTPLVVCS